MRKRLKVSKSVIATAGIAIFCSGLTAGILTTSIEPPIELSPARTIDTAFASASEITDEREVDLQLATSPPTNIVTNRGGTITELDCRPGAGLESGKSNFALDGQRLLNLATTMPLWRNFSQGDEGDDVRAVKIALQGLGYSLSEDATWDSTGSRALRTAFKEIEASPPPDNGSFDQSIIVWIPSTPSAVASCDSALGRQLAPGTSLASLPPTIESASLTASPDEGLPGARVINIEGKEFELSSGRVQQDLPLLQAIQGSAAYASLEASETRISFSSHLKEPIKALSIPPSAIHDLNGSDGCVTTELSSVPVKIITSQLGFTLIQPVEELERNLIYITPAKQTPCIP
ncbi:hypothetical protein [Rathayibacter tritici]|uniref:hypothetical protein n=1 Tax=Rathayibacter tritici TaxID=33888 RepID=UPI0011B01850|nr:hypothetical protein [Rathayibacter tritici]